MYFPKEDNNIRKALLQALYTKNHNCHCTVLTFRHLMVVEEDGRFMTQRKYPKMTLIEPAVYDDSVHLNAPDMQTLVISRKHQISKNKILNCRCVGLYCTYTCAVTNPEADQHNLSSQLTYFEHLLTEFGEIMLKALTVVRKPLTGCKNTQEYHADLFLLHLS